MAKNNFSLKSLTELEAMATAYGTTVASFLEDSELQEYEIAEVSQEEFLNISTFLNNAVIKDGSLIEDAEDDDSIFFSTMLRKYFEEAITVKDIVTLKNFVNKFNSEKTDLIYNNIYGYVYGVNIEKDGIDYSSIFGRMVSNIKAKIRSLMEFTVTGTFIAKDIDGNPNTTITNIDTTKITINTPIRGTGIPVGATVSTIVTDAVNGEITISSNILQAGTNVNLTFSTLSNDITYDLAGWYTNSPGSFNTMTALGFYNSLFNKSKLIETIVLIQLINYINDEITTVFEPTVGVNTDLIFTGGNVIKPETSGDFLPNNIANGTSKVSYSNRITLNVVEYFRRIENFMLIKDDNGKLLLSIPLNVTEAPGVYIDGVFSASDVEVTKEVFSTLGGEVTLTNVYTTLENALYHFLVLLYNGTESDVKDYFGTDAIRKIQSKLAADYQNTAYLFKNKDLIQDNWFISNSSGDPKTHANEYEDTIAKDGQQVIFIDVKDIILADQTDITKSQLETLFPGIDLTQRLTYTVLYKELNTILREQCLIDSQEYVMSRLLATLTDGKNVLFASDQNGLSFSTSIDTFYRSYDELDALFDINNDFYRYKYFYNNIYITRLSNESDLVGYYVGDNTQVSAFTNNYGYEEYEQREIENFLAIYQETRNYYYKVLLNKSFIQENEYKLYERLFISFFAIERFMNSKIDNIHDPDYFNSTDIYNFLESYGLGVLNDEKYDFIIEERNYKLNIVKLFNELVKLKGSRDVISILLQAFEVGDLEAEIKKFLILEETDQTEYPRGNAINGASTIKFIEVPYFSDNGSREIFNALGTSTDYENFLLDDPYWDSSIVTTDDLLTIGLDVSETKYLSLTLSENIYKKYVLSRYAMSTLDYLEANLLKGTDPILYTTRVDAGELFNLSGNISLYSMFDAVKVKYKALLKLYDSSAVGGLANYIDPGSAGMYYGINTTVDWDFLTDNIDSLLKEHTHDYTNNLSEFTTAHRATDDQGTGEVVFSRFNIYKETANWINYDNRTTIDNLDMFFRKYDYTEMTEIARQIQDVIFSTHKTNYGKTDATVENVYQNAGIYMKNLFENLNLLRLKESVGDNITANDLWTYILSKYWNKDYEQPDSLTYDPSGTDLHYKDLYYNVIEDIMQLPVDFFDGLLSPYSETQLNVNEPFQKFTEEIMTNVYRTPNDPIFIDTTTYIVPDDLGTYLDESILIANGTTTFEGDELDAKIIEITTDILTIIDGMQTLFTSDPYMQWSLSLRDQEESTLQFVQTAVEIFLSYTTELYYTTFKKTYNSYSEIVPLSHALVHRLDATKTDMVFYDDKLDIETLTEGDE